MPCSIVEVSIQTDDTCIAEKYDDGSNIFSNAPTVTEPEPALDPKGTGHTMQHSDGTGQSALDPEEKTLLDGIGQFALDPEEKTLPDGSPP